MYDVCVCVCVPVCLGMVAVAIAPLRVACALACPGGAGLAREESDLCAWLAGLACPGGRWPVRLLAREEDLGRRRRAPAAAPVPARVRGISLGAAVRLPSAAGCVCGCFRRAVLAREQLLPPP
jgi:hypothetical protein